MLLHGTSITNKILFVLTGLGIGGAESQVVRLASELRARAWEVALVSLVRPVAYQEQLEKQGIAVYSLGMKAGVPDIRAVLRLRSIIRRFRPDVVHSHMFHANLLGRITRLLCRMPTLICTAHSTIEDSTKGGACWHKDFLYRVTDPLANGTTIMCRPGWERLVQVRAVPAHKLHLIPNGIDTEVFSRSEHQRRQARHELGIGREFVWLAVGRLVRVKDYPTLFGALELLSRPDLLILIAGDGPLADELRAQSTRRSINDRVRFCGGGDDILQLYRAADAFVMSSEREGLSLALLEAASMGLPAVVTHVGGNPEIVVDGVTGYLVPRRDSTKLAAAMQQMMKTGPERRSAMGYAARQHCLAHYRMSSVVDRWIELYSELLPVPPRQNVVENPAAA